MARRGRPPSQGSRTFLRNHADGIVAMDLSVRGANNFVSAFLWLADPAPRSPPHLMDGRDGTPDCRVDRPPAHGSLRMGPGTNIPAARSRSDHGQFFTRRMRAMGILDQPTSPRSPWQSAYAERLIGSIRRECVDHIVVFGERHLRHALLSYMNYYNEVQTHLSLGKDAPVSRAVHTVGRIFPRPILGGLHHE